MRNVSVCLIHNTYQTPGGEDSVAQIESAQLARHGVTVRKVIWTNDNLSDESSVKLKARAALDTIWSRSSQQHILGILSKSTPVDLFHVHNTFPTASPSIYSAARSTGAAVVQTLHNYRLICPNAIFFRDGNVCEDCLGKSIPWPGLLHACYRGSRAASGITAAMLTVHRARRTWHNEVDLFIALTEFSRQKFIEGGLPADRIIVKPNFIDRPNPPNRRSEDYFLFAGRLANYKGASLLSKAWEALAKPHELRIAGDGPERDAIGASVERNPQITMLGSIPSEEVQHQMAGALALVFPSLLYETFGMSIIEAFAAGLPVIASRLGAMQEIVDDGRTGLLFAPGNPHDLAATVRWAADHPDEIRQMGTNARREYEAKYTAEIGYRNLIACYEQAIEIRKGRA